MFPLAHHHPEANGDAAIVDHCFMRSMVENDEPASWNDVMPFDNTSFEASSSRLARRRGRRRGWCEPDRMRSRAAVRSGCPIASFKISPPGGFGVDWLMSDSSIALALTKLAWPLACVSSTGLLGETASSDACVGNPSTFGSGLSSTSPDASLGR